MKLLSGAARILLATDSGDDVQQILRQLKSTLEHVQTSTNPVLTVRDVEDYRPDVLVFALDSFEKAQRYDLGPYRLGQTLQQHIHRHPVHHGRGPNGLRALQKRNTSPSGIATASRWGGCQRSRLAGGNAASNRFGRGSAFRP